MQASVLKHLRARFPLRGNLAGFMRVMTNISSEAKARQDAARTSGGQFGEQHRSTEEVSLAASPIQLTGATKTRSAIIRAMRDDVARDPSAVRAWREALDSYDDPAAVDTPIACQVREALGQPRWQTEAGIADWEARAGRQVDIARQDLTDLTDPGVRGDLARAGYTIPADATCEREYTLTYGDDGDTFVSRDGSDIERYFRPERGDTVRERIEVQTVFAADATFRDGEPLGDAVDAGYALPHLHPVADDDPTPAGRVLHTSGEHDQGERDDLREGRLSGVVAHSHEVQENDGTVLTVRDSRYEAVTDAAQKPYRRVVHKTTVTVLTDSEDVSWSF